MFGLPMSTTLIMVSVIAFWIVYTLVFYVSTRSWAVEDNDYAPAPEVPTGRIGTDGDAS